MVFCLLGTSSHYWVWCHHSIAVARWKSDQHLSLRSFPPQPLMHRTPPHLHLHTAAQFCHKSLFLQRVITSFVLTAPVALPLTWPFFLDSWIFRKWMSCLCLWEEEIKDFKIIAWLPQEIPGAYSWCAGLRVVGGDGRLELEWATAKTKLNFLKKLKWLHALPLFAGRETRRKRTATNWKTSYLSLVSKSGLYNSRAWVSQIF